MARLSLLTLLLASSVLGLASPRTQQETLQSALSDKWKWSDCGLDSNPIHIESIEITPDPPKPGEDLTVTVKGVASERVEEGAYADVAVKVGRIKILQKEVDLCEEAANTSVQCPVEEGEYTVTHTVTLPKEIPQAPFNVEVDGYTVEDEDLVCLRLSIDFRKTPGRLLTL
ncbi:unnamed protein product [Somion occarium]|uniref:Phosphatidylglycerol/phosphatidylinositol transfer protein n=1 Tax=Somion occarium TaxID=3059160 RepID=A0ABP1CIB4_9APHY